MTEVPACYVTLGQDTSGEEEEEGTKQLEREDEDDSLLPETTAHCL